MGSDSSVIRVTCDCGREMRVSRKLMGTKTKCPACGAEIQLPGDPLAGIGPACPHCGRPWPVSESRCPSCLARSRQRKRRRDEESDESTSVFSGRFASQADDGLDAAYEAPPSMEAATVRNAAWYEKPTAVGWNLAAGLMALAALLTFAYAAGPVWYGVAAFEGLVAFGLFRNSSAARTLLLGGTTVGTVIALGLILALTPDVMTPVDAGAIFVALVIALTGLALLTRQHGQVALVAVGVTLAGVGIIALHNLVTDVGPTEAERAEIAAKLKAGLDDVKQTLSTSRPAVTDEDSEADETVEMTDAAEETDETDLKPEPRPAEPIAPIVVEMDVPESTPEPLVEADEAVEAVDAEAVVEAEPEPAEPATPWPDKMAEQRFFVRFPDPSAVELVEDQVELEGRVRTETTYLADGENLRLRATMYEGVVPLVDDPNHTELGVLARHVAEVIGGEIQFKIWRRGKGPRVYFIRSKFFEGQYEWSTRIEARRTGSRILVMSASHNRHERRAAGEAKAFFKSLKISDVE